MTNPMTGRTLLACLVIAWPGVIAGQQNAARTGQDSTTPGSALYETGRLLARAGQALVAHDTAAALEAYEAILRLKPGDPTALYLRGEVRYARHDTAGGRRDLERAAALGLTIARVTLDMRAHPYTPPTGGAPTPATASRAPTIPANASSAPTTPRLMPGHRVIPGQRRSSVVCCPEPSWWTGSGELLAVIALFFTWLARRPVAAAKIPLQPGERLLWDGRPAPRFRLSALDVALSLAGLAVYALVSFLTFTPITHIVEGETSGTDWGILLLFVPMFGFVGVVLFFGRYVFNARIDKATHYAVTTERVIVADPSITSMPIAEVPELLVTDNGDGTGTIGFLAAQGEEASRALARAESADALHTPLAFGAANREKARQQLGQAMRMERATLTFEGVERPKEAYAEILRAVHGQTSEPVVEAPAADAPVTDSKARQLVTFAQRANRAMGVVAFLGLIVFGLAGMAMLSPPLFRYSAQRSWVAVACDIASKQTRQTYTSLRSGYFSRFRWDASWQYDYGGQHYTAATFGFSPLDTIGHPRHIALTTQLAQLKPGERSTCWVNPADPNESVFDRRFDRRGLFELVMLLPFIGGVTGMTYLVRRRPEHA